MTFFFISAGTSGQFSGAYPGPIFPAIRHLSENGHRVILCLADAPRRAEMEALGKFCTIFLADCADSAGKESHLPGPGYNRRFLDEVIINVAHTHPDIIVVEQLQSAPYGIEIRRHFEIPVILRVYHVETEFREASLRNTLNPFRKIGAWFDLRRSRQYEAEACAGFDLVMPVSEGDQKRLMATNKHIRTEIVQPAVDISYFSPRRQKSERNSILLYSSFHWVPACDAFWWFVKEVFPGVLEKVPDAVLYVVGNEPSADMQKFWHPNVRVIGPAGDIRDYTAGCTTAVVPLRSIGGAPFELMELLSMEKAVVSTSHGCRGLNVSDKKHLIIADDPKLFGSAVVDLINNHHERQRLGKSARELIMAEYSWDSVILRYEEIAQRLLKPERRTVRQRVPV